MLSMVLRMPVLFRVIDMWGIIITVGVIVLFMVLMWFVTKAEDYD